MNRAIQVYNQKLLYARLDIDKIIIFSTIDNIISILFQSYVRCSDTYIYIHKPNIHKTHHPDAFLRLGICKKCKIISRSWITDRNIYTFIKKRIGSPTIDKKPENILPPMPNGQRFENIRKHNVLYMLLLHWDCLWINFIIFSRIMHDENWSREGRLHMRNIRSSIMIWKVYFLVSY